MDVLGSLTVPVVPTLPANASGEKGQLVMVDGDGPYLHDGLQWNPYEGASGDNGSVIHSGTTVPDDTFGELGDYYLDTVVGNLYGPKSTVASAQSGISTVPPTSTQMDNAMWRGKFGAATGFSFVRVGTSVGPVGGASDAPIPAGLEARFQVLSSDLATVLAQTAWSSLDGVVGTSWFSLDLLSEAVVPADGLFWVQFDARNASTLAATNVRFFATSNKTPYGGITKPAGTVFESAPTNYAGSIYYFSVLMEGGQVPDWGTPISLIGPEGPQGIQGAEGPQGIQGVQGPKGDTGDIGPAGPTVPLNQLPIATGSYSMNGNKITSHGTPSISSDVATKGYVDGRRLDQIALPAAIVSLNGNRLVSVGTPTTTTDAATKAYVDAQDLATGRAWTNITLANGWVKHGSGLQPAFMIDPRGIVHLRGLAASGSSNIVGTIGTVAARPTNTIRVAVVTANGYGACQMDIRSDGSLALFGTWSASYLAFDGVQYIAE